MDNGSSSHHCHHDVLHLIDKNAACLLRLLEFQRLLRHSEKIDLGLLPFLAFPLFAILQLDFLHGGDKLVGSVVVDSLLFEEFVIEDLPALQKESHPTSIQNASEQEYRKHYLNYI